MTKTLARRSAAEPGGDDSGFSLVEAVVAVVLLAVLAVGVEAAVLGTMRLTVESQRRVTATHLASRELDLVRETMDAGGTGAQAMLQSGTVVNPHPIESGADTVVVSGVSYTVTRTVSYRTVVPSGPPGVGGSVLPGGSEPVPEYTGPPTTNDNGGGSLCDLDGKKLTSGLLAYVTVDVSWPGRRAAASAARVDEVMVTDDVATAATHSWVAVRVTDAAAPPVAVAGARATVVNEGTGATVTTVTTDASGCAVARVSPGSGTSYEVRVSKPGYVSPGWASEPRLAVGVVTADDRVHQVAASLAAAGSLKFTLVDESLAPVGAAAAGKLAHLVADTGRASENEVVQALTSDTWQTSDIYPGTYSVWVTDDPGIDAAVPVPMPQVEVGAGQKVEVLVSATRGIVAVVTDGVPVPIGGAGP